MVSRMSLLGIGELKLTGIINSMEDEQFNEYCKGLEAFIEKYPAHETNLKNSFAAGNNGEFTKELLIVSDMLKKIHAHDLEKNCIKLIGDVKKQTREVAEAFLNYLITSISSLSIDIQVVMYQKAGKPEKQEEAVAIGEAGPKKILAVDDVSLILNMLKTILQNTPYKFVGVTSGTAALKYLENNTPSLFLLDIEMPDMNGYDLAQKIRECKKTAPIIFLTGNATKEYVAKAIMLGAADFIVKPVDAEQVLAKINKYLM